MKEKTFVAVIASNRRQFEDWARYRDGRRYKRDELRLVMRPEDAMGAYFRAVEYIGSSKEHPAYELGELIAQRMVVLD